MINRDSYKSLIESVNAAVTGEEEVKKTETDNAVEWDSIDEILAEGIAAFGEENFIAILENFEETGELPEEMIELIDSISDEDDE
jgi:hypothetical protein